MLHKLVPEGGIGQEEEVLEMFFTLDGPDQGETVPVLEEVLQHAPDLVLPLNGIGTPLLRLQRLLKVVPRLDRSPVLVDQVEGEVAEEP